MTNKKKSKVSKELISCIASDIAKEEDAHERLRLLGWLQAWLSEL